MPPEPVVHLELHTSDLPRATRFYWELFGWRPEHVRAGGASYLSLQTGGAPGGGVVECGTDRPIWLPYVQVPEIQAATERAQAAGASLLLPPREGPAGFRCVVESPEAGEIALWQQKR